MRGGQHVCADGGKARAPKKGRITIGYGDLGAIYGQARKRMSDQCLADSTALLVCGHRHGREQHDPMGRLRIAQG